MVFLYKLEVHHWLGAAIPLPSVSLMMNDNVAFRRARFIVIIQKMPPVNLKGRVRQFSPQDVDELGR
jgi:hypothetical protein